MTTTTPGALRLVAVHTKFQLLETIRIPVAVIGNTVFPALALFFFVVPQAEVAGNRLWATTAVAGLAFFSVCSASMFTHGLGVSEDRESPFDPFVRALPAGPVPRFVGRILVGLVMALLGMVPLLLVAAFFTEAGVPAGRLLAGVGTLLVGAVPFILVGIAIGYALTAKAAIAIVQVVLFPLAFAGGLFMPPSLFPAWMDTVSLATPTRAGRDLLVDALGVETAAGSSWFVLLAWTVVLGVLAVWAYRRDEGRRFR